MRYLGLVLLAAMFLGPHSTWQVVPSANDGTGYNTLLSVTATSPRTIWAVGQTWPATGGHQPLVERCDTHGCQVVPSPTIVMPSSDLHLVAAIPGTTHVWAAGYSWNNGVTSSFFEYYNGTLWSVVPSPVLPGPYTYLSGLVALSENNAWAVGMTGPRNDTGQALIEHWNGHLWQMVPSPTTSMPNAELDGISAISTDDMWAVGGSWDTGANYATPLAEHYHGHTWRVVPTGLGNGGLGPVIAFSNHNIWATYEHSGFFPQMAHYDGAAWHAVNLPRPANTFPLLYDITGVAGQVWVVGSDLNEGTLIYHYDEGHWSVTTTYLGDRLCGVVALSTTNVWAVGDTGDSVTGHTITFVVHSH